MKLCIAIAALVLFAACNQGQKTQAPALNTDSTFAITDTFGTVPANAYMRLEGVIGNLPVVMHLTKAGEIVKATYYYKNVGIPISIDNYIANDSLSGVEWPNIVSPQNMNNEKGSGTWKCKIYAHAVKGKFTGTDGKKLDVLLYENYPEDSYHFSVVQNKDSLLFSDTIPDGPRALVSDTYIVPNDKRLGNWFENNLKDIILGRSSVGISMADVIDSIRAPFYAEYKLAEFFPKNGRSIQEAYYLNHTQESFTTVEFNANNFVVISSLKSDYLGGAHGNHFTEYTCIDVLNRKKMELADVIQLDSMELKTILENKFRQQVGLRPGAPLKEYLFENYLYPNKNFAFTNKGIYFSYAPYEVAAYVFGQIGVFIPFDELVGKVNGAFALRMGLKESATQL